MNRPMVLVGKNARLCAASALALTIAGSALAADLPPAPPPPPPRAPAAYIPAPVPLYNWTGFYLGGNLGGVFSGLSASDSLGSTLPTRPANRSLVAARSASTISSGAAW